jgi:hypothetical protein
VKILVEQNLFTLGGRQFPQRIERSLQQGLGERTPGTVGPLLEILVPPPRFLGECPDRGVNRDPETREQTDQHIESFVPVEGREMRPGQTSFEEQRVGVGVVIDQFDSSIPCPGIESLCFVLALSMWPSDLEDHVSVVRSRGR